MSLIYRNIEQYKEAADYFKEFFTQFGIPEAGSVFTDSFADGVYNRESYIAYCRSLLGLLLKQEYSERIPNTFFAALYYNINNY